MKLIIEIPDEVYNFIKNRGHIPHYVNIAPEIEKGIVLPEGHGDLIDRTALREELIENEWINGIDSGGLENIIDEAIAVIPADK